MRQILFGIAALALASLPSVGSAAPVDQATPTTGPAPAAGQATAPAGQAPALMIQSDLAIGAPGPCILQSRFAPGDRVVFRAKVFDAHTGQQVIDGNVSVRIEGAGPLAGPRWSVRSSLDAAGFRPTRRMTESLGAVLDYYASRQRASLHSTAGRSEPL